MVYYDNFLFSDSAVDSGWVLEKQDLGGLITAFANDSDTKKGS